MTRTLSLPAIQELLPRLVAELPVFGGNRTDCEEILTSGKADAVALDAAGGIDVVIDWKSDTAPSPSAVTHYQQQLDDYRKLTGAKRGLLIFMTPGKVVEIA